MDEKTPPLDPTKDEDKKAARKAYMKAYLAKWRANNPKPMSGYYRKYKLRKKYGISLNDYGRMVDARNGVCDICKKPPIGRGKYNRLHVDHNHDTGVVRGLLCGKCNTGLGMFGDSPETLTAAASYINANKTII